MLVPHLVIFQSPDAFLQSKERRIDFCTFCSALRVVRFRVVTTFAARKIDKGKLAAKLGSVLVTKNDLANGMRSRRSVVCFGCMSCASPVVTRKRTVSFLGTLYKQQGNC